VSRWDRLLVFGACNLAALACFVLCFALFPLLWAVPRKFAILFVYPVHIFNSKTLVSLIALIDSRLATPPFPFLPVAGRMRLEARKKHRSSTSFDCLKVMVSSSLQIVTSITGRVANLAVIYKRWSFGSVLFLASWAVLMGPVTYAKHLLSTPRLPFSAAYFGSIGLTLYFSIGVRPLPPPP